MRPAPARILLATVGQTESHRNAHIQPWLDKASDIYPGAFHQGGRKKGIARTDHLPILAVYAEQYDCRRSSVLRLFPRFWEWDLRSEDGLM